MKYHGTRKSICSSITLQGESLASICFLSLSKQLVQLYALQCVVEHIDALSTVAEADLLNVLFGLR